MATDAEREYMRQWAQKNRKHIREYREQTKAKRNERRRELYRTEEWRREAAVEAERQRRIKHPLARKQYKYHVPAHELELMMNEGCAICGANPLIDSKVVLHIDHDHKTGKVRGILCNSCNLALGHLRDDPIIIAEMLRYILKG